MRFSSPTSLRSTRPTIDWIQALRGLAAVLVVVTHSSRALTSEQGREMFWNYFVHGALGVDLFFIISGFIMVLTTQHCDGTRRYVADFLIKRFSRIWPLLFVVSMTYIAIEWLRHGSVAAEYLGHIMSQLVFRPVHPKPEYFFLMPIDVAWTLCFEAYFYVVIAVSLLSRQWRWWIVAALLMPGLVLYPLYKEHWNLSFYHQPAIVVNHYLNLVVSPMVWEFVFGLVAGRLYLSRWQGPPRWLAICFVLGAVAAFVTVPVTHMPSLYGPTIEFGGLTMFGAFLLLVMASKAIDIPVARGLVWLGTISYSVYLTHRLGFIPAEALMDALHIADATEREWTGFAVHIACGVAAGAFFYYTVEAPLSAFTRQTLLHLRKQVWARRTEGFSGQSA